MAIEAKGNSLLSKILKKLRQTDIVLILTAVSVLRISRLAPVLGFTQGGSPHRPYGIALITIAQLELRQAKRLLAPKVKGR
jgi:hypothetical protein